MDKKLVKFLIIFVCISILWFLLLGFYSLSNNPAAWYEGTRALFVAGELVALAGSCLVVYGP